jgi:hypothetical protein
MDSGLIFVATQRNLTQYAHEDEITTGRMERCPLPLRTRHEYTRPRMLLMTEHCAEWQDGKDGRDAARIGNDGSPPNERICEDR